MKTIKLVLLSLIITTISSCAELQKVVDNLPQQNSLSNAQIANGLKEALQQGIDKQVSLLMEPDGFYKDQMVRILLPEELQKVDKALRDIGLNNLADQGIKLLNSAASDAVKEAKPIFVQAITTITFEDAKNILLGDQTAATQYLKAKTATQLYDKFKPQVKQSLQKVKADEVWEEIITRYNQIPFVQRVNPDLTDYVTQKAMDGVYVKIGVEEINIRKNVQERSTDLLKKVFALQDNRNN